MENLLERALIFINRWSYVFYGVGGLGLILYFRRAREAFHQRRYTPFPIEREEASTTLRDALLIMLVIIAILGTTFYIDRILLADLPSAGAEQSFFDRAFFATPTPPAIGSTIEQDEEGQPAEESNGESSQQDNPESAATEEDKLSTPESAAAEEDKLSTPESTTAQEESVPTQEAATPTIEPTETPVAASCEAPGVNITSPANGEVLRGNVAIVGDATIDRFQSYKIEYGKGISPDTFEVLGERLESIQEGLLMEWAIDSLDSGVWTVRLTVVDETGNGPTPCEIQVVIR